MLETLGRVLREPYVLRHAAVRMARPAGSGSATASLRHTRILSSQSRVDELQDLVDGVIEAYVPGLARDPHRLELSREGCQFMTQFAAHSCPRPPNPRKTALHRLIKDITFQISCANLVVTVRESAAGNGTDCNVESMSRGLDKVAWTRLSPCANALRAAPSPPRGDAGVFTIDDLMNRLSGSRRTAFGSAVCRALRIQWL